MLQEPLLSLLSCIVSILLRLVIYMVLGLVMDFKVQKPQKNKTSSYCVIGGFFFFSLLVSVLEQHANSHGIIS